MCVRVCASVYTCMHTFTGIFSSTTVINLIQSLQPGLISEVKWQVFIRLSLLLPLTFCLLSRTTPCICHIRFHFGPVLISRRLNNE